MEFSSYRRRWFLAVLAATVTKPFAAANTILLDEAILTDLLHEYDTHEATECSSSTADTTAFSFTYPGVRNESEWDPEVEGFEASLFQAMMSHTDANGRSWEMRIGTSGNMYSHFVPEMYGETMSPQTYSYAAPWVDEVNQMVSVNTALNSNPDQMEFCPNEETECAPFFIHQAGAYTADSPYTDDAPVYSPSLAKHCSENFCIFASWGTQAHVPTPFTSPIIYITKFTNCGDGIIEHTQMIHNFADPGTSNPLYVDQDYFNVGWAGVRSSNLPYALEPTNDVLTYGDANDVNNVDYLPLCRWGDDTISGGPSGRAEMKDISELGGYTTFVADGLIVNRTEDLELPCKNSEGVMVESCNEDNINNGYERFPLGVRAGSGPNCKVHNNPNPYDGYVALQCDLSLDMTFGPTTPYASNPDPCAPWKDSRIGFYNTATGAMLEVSYVRHWSWSTTNYKVYFSVFINNTGSSSQNYAKTMVNNMFAAGASDIPIELRTVYVSPVKPPTPLGVPQDGPNCQFHNTTNPYQGLVALQCNLMSSTGFVDTDVNEATPIRLYNTVTGKSLKVAYVKHWSLSADDYKVYFSVYHQDDGPNGTNRALAIEEVDVMFANIGNTAIPIAIRSVKETSIDDVPAFYDPAPLPTFTYVYGKGEDYLNVNGRGRRRIGSTVDTRDFTVFTINWLGGAKLRAGETYLNRGFMFSSDLGSVEATASNLTTKIYIDEIALEGWTPRIIDIYQDQASSRFAVIAASSADRTSTTCSALVSVPPACSGTSTPKIGHSPFFYVTCGETTYLGSNPYHFTPSFGASFPDHGLEVKDHCILVTTGSVTSDAGDLEVFVNSGNGDGYVLAANGTYGSDQTVLDECFADIVGVQVKGPTTNAWVGNILVSTDKKGSYDPFTCLDCTGTTNIAGTIVVADNGASGDIATTQCLGGRTCTLSFSPPFCILVKTGPVQYNNGYADVLVDSGNGDGYVLEAGENHGRGQVIVDKCFSDIVGVQVKGTNDDAWVGGVFLSTDNRVSYSAFRCDDCTGTTNLAANIIVDGNDDDVNTATTQCRNGATCTLSFPPPVCIRVTTGSLAGYLNVLVNSNNGKGFVEVSVTGRLYEVDEVVVDQCFANLVGVQVKGTADNAWMGSILVSTDNQLLYDPFTCLDCSGTTNTTTSIVVGGNDDSGGDATTQCLGGNTCTLPFNLLCIQVKSGRRNRDAGHIDVLVDSGNGYVNVSELGAYHKKRTVVVDQCFANLVGVQVRGTSPDAWLGSILLSSDNKVSYYPLVCDDCTGTTNLAGTIIVHGDEVSSFGAPTYCRNGNTCTLPVHVPQTVVSGLVRSYACNDKDLSVRPSWKLMGFFNSSDSECAGLATSTYDEDLCGVFV